MITEIGAVKVRGGEILGEFQTLVQPGVPVPAFIALLTGITAADVITRVLGFKPQHSVEDAIRDVSRAFKAGKLPNSFDDPKYYNVKTLKDNGVR